MNSDDKPKTATQGMRKERLTELPPYQSKEWFDIPNREKIEFIASGMRFDREMDYAGNTMRQGLDCCHYGQASYEESLEIIVLEFHRQLNILYKEKLDMAMLSTTAKMFIPNEN